MNTAEIEGYASLFGVKDMAGEDRPREHSCRVGLPERHVAAS